MKENTCFYCNKIQTDIASFIFESKYWRVYLNDEQSYLGRSVVALKTHKASLSDLTNEEWADFADVVKRLEYTVKTELGAKIFNWTCMMNDVYQKDIPNPHVHWHLRPRYDHEVKIGDKVFSDPDFGQHYNRERKEKVNDDMVEKIAAKIKASLSL